MRTGDLKGNVLKYLQVSRKEGHSFYVALVNQFKSSHIYLYSSESQTVFVNCGLHTPTVDQHEGHPLT